MHDLPFRIVPLARHVEEQICREGQELLSYKSKERPERCIAEVFAVVNLMIVSMFAFLLGLFRGDAELRTRPGNIDFVAFHRSVVGVMAVMDDLPAEVRGPQKGVQDETKHVADNAGRRKCTMSAL